MPSCFPFASSIHPDRFCTARFRDGIFVLIPQFRGRERAETVCGRCPHCKQAISVIQRTCPKCSASVNTNQRVHQLFVGQLSIHRTAQFVGVAFAHALAIH